MGLIAANGFGVLALRFTMPVSGVWVAELDVDTDQQLEGAIEIADEGIIYRGTILRSGVLVGSCRLEAVGGAGGLREPVDARSYQGVTVRAVLQDLLGAVGERLDPSSTAAILNTTLPYWTRGGGTRRTAKTALQDLADAVGARWRVLPSGAVWFGTDTWPAVSDSYEALELDRDDAAGTVLLAPETIALNPGVVLEGRRVGRVEHHVSQTEDVRTTFWIDTEAA